MDEEVESDDKEYNDEYTSEQARAREIIGTIEVYETSF